MPTTIDLTQDADYDPPPTDHITALPAEILQTVTSYLYATHFPEQASLPIETHPNPFADLIALHRSCKILSQQTSSWAHHFLHHHRTITRYRDYKTPTAAAKQRPLTELLQWTSKRCVFCGAKSDRTAILMNGLHCCQKCDRREWPDKVTKTEAKKKFKLKDRQLLPERYHAFSLLGRYPGLPRLRYGTYYSNGVVTTMFVTGEVEAMSKLAESDMSGHLRERRKARDLSFDGPRKNGKGKEVVRTTAARQGKTIIPEIVSVKDNFVEGTSGDLVFTIDGIVELEE